MSTLFIARLRESRPKHERDSGSESQNLFFRARVKIHISFTRARAILGIAMQRTAFLPPCVNGRISAAARRAVSRVR